jgi:membrane protein required for colicin V production
MTWVDLAVLGVLAISALLAFMRGFVAEVLGIGAWIGAALTALWAGPLARPQIEIWMDQWVKQPALVTPAAFGAVFLIALILLLILSRWIGELVRNSVLSGLDRSLGLLFGLARGAVLIICAYIGTGMLIPMEKWPAPVLDARLLPVAYRGAAIVVKALPPQYQPRLYAPPEGRETTAADLLHAVPIGRATGKPVVRE